MSSFSSFEKDKKIFDSWRSFLKEEITRDPQTNQPLWNGKTIKSLSDEEYAQYEKESTYKGDFSSDLSDNEKQQLNNILDEYKIENLEEAENIGQLLYWMNAKGVYKIDKSTMDKMSEAFSKRKNKIYNFFRGATTAAAAGTGAAAVMTALGIATAPAVSLGFLALAVLSQAGGDTANAIVDAAVDRSMKALFSNKNVEIVKQLIGAPDTGKYVDKSTPIKALFDLDDDYQSLVRSVEKKGEGEYSDAEMRAINLFVDKIVKANLGNLKTPLSDIAKELNMDDTLKQEIEKEIGIDVDRTEKDSSLYMKNTKT